MQVQGLKPLKTISKFGKEGQLYSFTTENLSYLNDLSFRNKNVLTIGGSYDQAIYAYLLGAKEVFNIDVNEKSKYYGELKHVAIQNLSYTEFKNFFLLTSNAFDTDTYKWLSRHLSQQADDFFVQLYKTYETGDELRKSNLFNNKFDVPEQKINNCIYLRDEKIYKNTQKIMRDKKFHWISSCLEEFLKTDFMWDIILLSNIADYSHIMFQGNHLIEFKENIVLPCLELLNPHGKLMFAYIFDAKNLLGSNKRNEINDSSKRWQLYSDIALFNYQEIMIPSAIEGAHMDCACVLSKND